MMECLFFAKLADMRICRVPIVLILLSLSFPWVSAIDPLKIPSAELFTTENGMSQTRIKVSFIDSYGFLWTGSRGGLNRFDGYRFEIFKHIPYDSTSLSVNNVNCITEDGNTNLWIGTNYGLNCFDRKTGKFRQFLHNPLDSNSISDHRVFSVFADRNGMIWIRTGEYIDRLNPADLSVKHIRYGNDDPVDNINESTCPITEDREGNLWFGDENGLCCLNPSDLSIKKYFNDPGNDGSISSNAVLTVFKDRGFELWIGTDNGLNRFDYRRRTFTRFLNKDRIRVDAITEDQEGLFWIASGSSLVIFDKGNPQYRKYESLYIDKASFTFGQVSAIQSDRSGIIWLSGLQGLFRIDTKPQKFRLYNSSQSSYPALPGENISALFRENENIIWTAVWGKGLSMLNRSTGAAVNYSASAPDRRFRISGSRITAIFKDNSGRIWLSSKEGLDIFEPDTRSFVPFTVKFTVTGKELLNDARINCMTEDRRGDIWFGTDRGVIRYRHKDSELVSYNRIFRGRTTTEMGIVYAITTDQRNRIWIGTQDGLNCYDPIADIYYRYTETGIRKDLSSGIVYSLYFDSDNTLWVGTASGLNRFDAATGTFEVFTEENGLPNDLVNAILEDKSKCLWISTGKGLSRYDKKRGEFTIFELSDGLQNYEFNRSAACSSPEGEFFFGGISGFNSFYPEDLPVNPHTPNVVITSIELNDGSGARQIFSGGDGLSISIRYNQSFTVGFAALDLTRPSANTFEYSLQPAGKDPVWVPLGNRNSLTVIDLPGGKISLRVRGSNNDGIWSPIGTQMTINSAIPIWRSRSAVYLYIALLIYLVYLLVQFITQPLRRSNKILMEREIAAKEISRQKDLLSLRNKSIEDSLNYAQRIQNAMLMTPRQFSTILPNSFVLHKPKDIVSGDFYWISEQDRKIFVAAADCTGHGVPGAFMSLISFELFKKIIKVEKIHQPSHILQTLNRNFEEVFGNIEDVVIKDGMDLSFCVLDKSMKHLQFSGAFNPLYIVRDDKLMEFKGDSFSIGADLGDGYPQKIFTNHEFSLQPGDMIYMFSDGYADQFGGPEGKKYKYRRFRYLLLNIHKLDLQKQMQILDENIEDWKGASEQVDDILVIGIKI